VEKIAPAATTTDKHDGGNAIRPRIAGILFDIEGGKGREVKREVKGTGAYNGWSGKSS
jgi:hypothetical protein